MKYLKQFFTIIIVAVFLLNSFSGSAQNNEDWIITGGPIIITSTFPDNSTFLDVPAEWKSTISVLKSKTIGGVKTATKYIKELKGNVVITVDQNNKIISIYVPKGNGFKQDSLLKINSKSSCPRPRECYTETNTNAGVLLCALDGIVCTIFLIFT